MKSKGVCIITSPFLVRASLPPLSNLVTLVSSFAPDLYVITGGSGKDLQFNSRAQVIKIDHDLGSNRITNMIRFAFAHVKIVCNLVRLKNVDTCIFFLGERTLVLPLIVSKLLKKKTIYISSCSLIKPSGAYSAVDAGVMVVLERICHLVSDIIVLYSSKLACTADHANIWGKKYHHKILIAHRHFLDFNAFTVTTPLPDRPLLVGYIGRLLGVKGVQHFVQALPAILSEKQDLRVLIGGDGHLKGGIETSLLEMGVTSYVDFPGWISHDDLPKYLNQLRLLVLPSYIEGLPNIMLEAMACGTPVLVTPVGAMPDVVIEGRTGFIMENNSPECIAENVVRALNSPDLEQIAENGRRFVEERFTFEKVVDHWEGILRDVS